MIGKTNSLTIIQQGGGSGSAMSPFDDVCFYDIDGSLIQTMSKEDFLAASSLPDIKDRSEDGLTEPIWVWSPAENQSSLQTLANFKNYVNSSGKIDLFPYYKVNNSLITISIKLENILDIYLHFGYPSGTGTIAIDWGDNTTSNITINSTAQHIPHSYANSGEYTITILPANTTLKVYKCELSYNATSTPTDTGQYSSGCEIVKKVIIGDGIQVRELVMHIKPDKDFKYVYKGNGSTTFVMYNFYNKQHIGLIDYMCLPNTLYYGGNPSITHLRYVSTNPSTFANSSYKNSVIRACVHAGIIYDFAEYHKLYELIIDSNFNSYLGAYGRELYAISNINLPNGVYFSNQIGRSWYQVKSIIGASHLSGGYCLQSVYLLETLEFASDVTAIGNSCVTDAYSLKTIKFTTTTPPTVGSSCFTGMPTTCKIYVPTGSLAAYTSTTNMPSSSTYTYVEY